LVESPPSAASVEAMPSLISCLAFRSASLSKVSGWFWLWVPTVWPAATSLRTPSGSALAWRPMVKKVALTHCGGENGQNLVRSARIQSSMHMLRRASRRDVLTSCVLPIAPDSGHSRRAMRQGDLLHHRPPGQCRPGRRSQAGGRRPYRRHPQPEPSADLRKDADRKGQAGDQ